MKIEHESTFKKAFDEEINLFLGAGFAILAKDQNGETLPLGKELREELIEKFKYQKLNTLPLDKICTILESEQREKFVEFIKQRFSVKEFSSKYFNLDLTAIKNIFTTNVDDLIYKIYADSKKYYINDLTLKGPRFGDRSAIDFVPLHGNVIYSNDRLVFKTADIVTEFSADPDKWHWITSNIQKHPTLFWGYAVEDASVIQAISPKSSSGRSHKPKWILLPEEDDASARYFKALDFNIIIGTTSEVLDYIKDVCLKEKKEARTSVSTADLFPSESIPPLGKASISRSLSDFYQGAPPIWSDIYSDRLYKTSHYSSVENMIYGKKNVVVLGIPACGKTTLMMQLAVNIDTKAHKLVLDSVSPEKANLILKKLGGQKALIFIDNLADDIEGFEDLIASENVQVVGFERDYAFEIASHKTSKELYKAYPVTTLSDKDIQEILSRIPKDIKISDGEQKETHGDSDISLFELVQSRLKGPKLSERFMGVLQNLEQKSEEKHDFLIMCCYVHSCRVPVSLDMAYAFLQKKDKTYTDVIEFVKSLGALISENMSIDEEQDYYSPRSTIVSEVIIKSVSPVSLKRVLLTFHRDVTPYRICRYDVFKRRAYDAKLLFKAFSNWEEGKSFYENVYNRDQSPFLLQQGALYLAKKYRFKDAFNWIDEALIATHSRVFSIRNTHAIILFQANIHGSNADLSIRAELDKSMGILSDCYSNDKRKTFHAITFADQAIAYYNKYGDGIAVDYLKRADTWCKEEHVKSPWDRRLRKCKEEIESRIKKL